MVASSTVTPVCVSVYCTPVAAVSPPLVIVAVSASVSSGFATLAATLSSSVAVILTAMAASLLWFSGGARRPRRGRRVVGDGDGRGHNVTRIDHAIGGIVVERQHGGLRRRE